MILTISIDKPPTHFNNLPVRIALVHKKLGNIPSETNTWQVEITQAPNRKGELVWQDYTVQHHATAADSSTSPGLTKITTNSDDSSSISTTSPKTPPASASPDQCPRTAPPHAQLQNSLAPEMTTDFPMATNYLGIK
jgi:hypothetical protein